MEIKPTLALCQPILSKFLRLFLLWVYFAESDGDDTKVMLKEENDLWNWNKNSQHIK